MCLPKRHLLKDYNILMPRNAYLKGNKCFMMITNCIAEELKAFANDDFKVYLIEVNV